MMHILFLILKIIGIILLILLCLIILILVSAVRYRADISVDESDKKVLVKASFFGPLIRVLYSYPEQAFVKVKILMFTVFDASKPKQTVPQDPCPEAPKEKFTFRQLCDKMKQGFEKVQQVSDTYAERDVQRLIEVIKTEMIRLIGAMSPKIRGSVYYGNEDPAITGEVTGIYAMLLPLHQAGFSFTPDFQQEALQINLRLKGHIRPIRLLKAGLTVMIKGRLFTAIRLWRSHSIQDRCRGEEVYEQ